MNLPLLLNVTVLAVFSGCAVMSPNLLFVRMRGINAKGTISKQREQIGLIEVNIRQLSESQINDLWIGLSATNQTSLVEVTEDLIRQIGVPSTNFYSAASDASTYFYCGYSFRFEGGHFAKCLANQYGFPPKVGSAFVMLGSRKNAVSLSLPCSLYDFEKVFGSADKVERGFGW